MSEHIHVPKPDAQMVIECAERIMGWQPMSGIGDRTLGYVLYSTTDGTVVAVRTNVNESVPHEWNPLTSDADAFMLVDALEAKGMGLTLTRFIRSDRTLGDYAANFYGSGADGDARDPDRKRAIVLAALKTVGKLAPLARR